MHMWYLPFLRQTENGGIYHTMKILFISLGCDKNLADTEVMLDFWHHGAMR